MPPGTTINQPNLNFVVVNGAAIIPIMMSDHLEVWQCRADLSCFNIVSSIPAHPVTGDRYQFPDMHGGERVNSMPLIEKDATGETLFVAWLDLDPADPPTSGRIFTSTLISFPANRCPCDCDGNGTATAAELQSALDIVNGAPLSTCPAADVNGDGIVRSGDYNWCLVAYQLGCGGPFREATLPSAAYPHGAYQFFPMAAWGSGNPLLCMYVEQASTSKTYQVVCQAGSVANLDTPLATITWPPPNKWRNIGMPIDLSTDTYPYGPGVFLGDYIGYDGNHLAEVTVHPNPFNGAMASRQPYIEIETYYGCAIAPAAPHASALLLAPLLWVPWRRARAVRRRRR